MQNSSVSVPVPPAGTGVHESGVLVSRDNKGDIIATVVSDTADNDSTALYPFLKYVCTQFTAHLSTAQNMNL